MGMTMLKRTPLFQTHQQLNARLIDFGGWEMPVQYTSIVDEHQAVRNAAGIFDISHMGEVFVSGPSAGAFLNGALTNDIRKLSPGLGQYTLMCNEKGGVVDDLYAYCLAPDRYLLIVNASRIEADVQWLTQLHQRFPNHAAVTLEDQSGSYAAVALQGPKCALFIDQAFPAGAGHAPVSSLEKNQVRKISFAGDWIYVARTGYTGEDGFEVVAPAPLIEKVWAAAFQAGQGFGLKPCGLGARDTLRTEACYPLYGHELDEATTPIEAGLGFFVALDKGPFTGSAVLLEQKKTGTARKLAAFKMTGKSAPPRPGYAIFSESGQALGSAVSGTQSPTLSTGIGLGYIQAGAAQPGTPLQIEIRGNRFPAIVVKKPFYKRPS